VQHAIERGEGVIGRKNEPQNDEASCYTVVVFIPCSLQLHSHCLQSQTYYCTYVNGRLLDMPDNEVITIVGFYGYSSFLSMSL